MTAIIQLQYSLADSRVFHDVKNITQSSLHPTQPKPTQPNRWMDPTHDQLCSGICMTGFECLSNCYGSRAVPVGHGSQFRWVTESWVTLLDSLPALRRMKGVYEKSRFSTRILLLLRNDTKFRTVPYSMTLNDTCPTHISRSRR